MSVSTLNDVSANLLKAEKSILNSFEGKESLNAYPKVNTTSLIPDDICSVFRPESAIIEVRFPSFLPPYRYEWYSRQAKTKGCGDQYFLDAEFDFITEAAIRNNLRTLGPIRIPDEQLFLVFRRGAKKYLNIPIDNNNVYTGAITNIICRVLKHGDRWNAMSFVYTVFPTEEKPYLSVILCRKIDLWKWI